MMLAGAAAIPAATCAEPQEGSGETDGYRLVWQDLFDNGILNDLRWNVEQNAAGGGNHELQYYADREENVRVGDDGQGNGCLILTARRENLGGRQFTSGRVNSRDKVAFTHGKVEASIKLPPTADGLWPAFWMMGNDYGEVGWPKSGETDILEMGHSDGIRNGTQDRYFNGAMHWGQGWPAGSYARSTTKNYSLQDGEFHLFTAVWDENEMRMYVDLDRQPLQTPYFRMGITHDDPGNEWSPGNYFHKLNFIIFNMAVGGDFTGIHEGGNITALNDANGHEASMYVNYVKVYQKGTADEDLYTVVPGDEASVADVSADRMQIALRGGIVTAPGAASIAVYDATGRLVAFGEGDRLDLAGLSPGIYVIAAGGSTLKTIIR